MGTEWLVAALIGIVAGVIAALCGVGGGIIMVPAFVLFLGLSQKHAVATSLTAIILISIFATAKNQASSLVNWPVAISCAIAGGMTAWFASDLLNHLSNQTLTRIFAFLMIGVGIRMLFQK
jgi:uncharacterized membrane protein YfcA